MLMNRAGVTQAAFTTVHKYSLWELVFTTTLRNADTWKRSIMPTRNFLEIPLRFEQAMRQEVHNEWWPWMAREMW